MDDEEVKSTISSGLLFVFGVFCYAFCYNFFLQPNDLVIGGVSGIALILSRITTLSPNIFIYFVNLVALFIGYVILGPSETKNTIIGSLLFPIMVTFTAPIAQFLIPYFSFNEFFVIALLTSLLYGFSNGLIYRYGFSIGGVDILVRILTHTKHIPEGKSAFIINFVVILVGGVFFGFTKAVYAMIILYISSLLIDKVMFGVSDSKVFYIYTKKAHLIKKVLLKEFHSGFTILPTKGGYSHQNGMMIMCVLPNREYYHFKKRILELDPKAFFVITECYESQGGFKQKNLPFI